MPATFTKMEESTVEDWIEVADATAKNQSRVADRIIMLLESLAEVYDGFAVDQLTHGLQTATRAERDGYDEQTVFAALCHDIGKAISVPNHAAISAEIIQPYVRKDVYKTVLTHQDFQGYHYYHFFDGDRNMRNKYANESFYELGMKFTDDWDQMAFDPDYDTLPLEHFIPLIRKVTAQALWRTEDE